MKLDSVGSGVQRLPPAIGEHEAHSDDEHASIQSLMSTHATTQKRHPQHLGRVSTVLEIMANCAEGRSNWHSHCRSLTRTLTLTFGVLPVTLHPMLTFGLVPVTLHPMINPWRRTPLYQDGPMRLIFTSWKPALVNHCSQCMHSISGT